MASLKRQLFIADSPAAKSKNFFCDCRDSVDNVSKELVGGFSSRCKLLSDNHLEISVSDRTHTARRSNSKNPSA